jgi:branched-chain amino acid transport system permease protein
MVSCPNGACRNVHDMSVRALVDGLTNKWRRPDERAGAASAAAVTGARVSIRTAVLAGLAAVSIVSLFLFGKGYPLQVADTVLYDGMLTLGLNLVMGYCGQYDFGHTTYAAIGAYTAAILMLAHPGLDYALVIVVSMLVAGAVAFVAAGLLFRFRGDYLALVTLASGLITQSIAVNASFTGGANGLPGVPIAHLVGFSMVGNEPYFVLGLVLVAAMMLVVAHLARTRSGRAMLAVREDELAASSLGIDPWRYKVLAFVIAGAFAGVGGAFLTGLFSFAGPDSFGLTQSITLAEMVIAGGIATISGSIAGAILFVVLESVLVSYFPEIAGHQDLLVGVLLLTLILTRPQGLFGHPFVKSRT